MWLLMNDLGLKARLAFSKFMCDEEGDVNISCPYRNSCITCCIL